ncbi:lipopolysaccharide heptosyltransferase I [Polynucleobacter asymbioticus]|uniref:Lipopolysaccharide heptosyltransferase 1 n=1 Tax=Polynucleobacter asymbioticus TaxID=576611 RepID=A0AAC9ITZ6_9BURK|nr:lipopolysaccharide heptosyltransferase I [Polynucleobacter asymbioticus]APB98104.1 lipopolysaccharide heptosyltransferase I [Polynucleobacter asymbioticus]APC00390.1 lipopolysaccharide heptosyltransferase I [Polynucleobacter asymbioticus]
MRHQSFNLKNLPPKILLVKLSSLGDVLHNLPIVWDIRARLPDAQIDWVVEEAYVHLLQPLLSRGNFKGIDRIIPFSLRRWKKSLFSLTSWKQFFSFKKELQEVTYDVVIETQGLLKSALVCALAKKTSDVVVAGLANATEYSGYEPLARLFYSQSVQVPFQCHAVDRSRYVLCSALHWPLINRDERAQFYPSSYVDAASQQSPSNFESPYVLFFHSTAREAKRWSNESWICLGNELASRGYQVILPWGNASEKAVSNELASKIKGAMVPKPFSVQEAFLIVGNAALVVGVDTGLTHLAAVMNKPTIEIYCDSPRWKTEGYWSNHIRNVGDIQDPPSGAVVLAAAIELLQ